MVWAGSSARLDELAKDLGAERKNFDLGKVPKFLAPLKYLVYFLMTQVFLFSRKPKVVYCQNPPILAPLACIPYCAITGRKLVIDHHNVWSIKTFGASALSGALKAMEHLADRTAFLNTVPHDYWRAVIGDEFSGRVLTIHDCVDKNPFSRNEILRRRASSSGLIGMAASLSFQERVEIEAMGVERVQGVTLAMTGPPERLGSRLTRLGNLRRVKFLGYLPKAEYEELKASCDFGLNVTDEPFTVNHTLFEYAAAALPIISTRSKEIEGVFGDSILYVEQSDVGEVAEKVAKFARDPSALAEYRERISRRFEELTVSAKHERALLRSLLSGS
jgi:glycosyltransferase involved in cell wall biosynthesis